MVDQRTASELDVIGVCAEKKNALSVELHRYSNLLWAVGLMLQWPHREPVRADTALLPGAGSTNAAYFVASMPPTTFVISSFPSRENLR